MDYDKMKYWLDVAQKFHGKDFWSGVFSDVENSVGPGEESTLKPSTSPSFPVIEVLQDTNLIIVIIEIPGIYKEDVELSMSDGLLYIKGEMKPSYRHMTVVSSERYAGPFERIIELPYRTKIGGPISAKFSNGLLEIRIPVMEKPLENIPIE